MNKVKLETLETVERERERERESNNLNQKNKKIIYIRKQ